MQIYVNCAREDNEEPNEVTVKSVGNVPLHRNYISRGSRAREQLAINYWQERI